MRQSREHYLLTVLMEECGEVVQAASKVVRFGPINRAPGISATNAETLSKELADIIAMADLLREHCVIPPIDERDVWAKKAKVMEYIAVLEGGEKG